MPFENSLSIKSTLSKPITALDATHRSLPPIVCKRHLKRSNLAGAHHNQRVFINPSPSETNSPRSKILQGAGSATRTIVRFNPDAILRPKATICQSDRDVIASSALREKFEREALWNHRAGREPTEDACGASQIRAAHARCASSEIARAALRICRKQQQFMAVRDAARRLLKASRWHASVE
jgi:hypothetical protein